MMGMRLAGIEGEVIHERDQIIARLNELIQDDSIAIILMTTKTVEQASDVVSGYKLNLKKPLIVEIPDRHMSGNISEAIDAAISDAIGIKL
jgi:V/A-type H+-transporting ATPase subunit F